MSGLAEYRIELGALVWTAQLSDEDRDRLTNAGAVVEPVGAVEVAPAVRRPARKSK